MRTLLILLTILFAGCGQYEGNYTFYVSGHKNIDYTISDNNGVDIGGVDHMNMNVEFKSATDTVVVYRVDGLSTPKTCVIRSYGYYLIAVGRLEER